MEETALALGIAHLLDRSTHELSGGELQRVALAAALVGRPRLVLLDEPTSQLDPVAGDELLGLLRRLNEEWGTTILLAEHRLERCLAAADRVVVLEGGRIACDAAAAALPDLGRGCRALPRDPRSAPDRHAPASARRPPASRRLGPCSALPALLPLEGSAGLRAGPVVGIVSPAQAPCDSDPHATRPIGVSRLDRRSRSRPLSQAKSLAS